MLDLFLLRPYAMERMRQMINLLVGYPIYPIYPTPPLGQDMTQGQFLSEV